MKKNIIWLIQSNQITPAIYEYLQVLKNRVAPFVNIMFAVPQTSAEMMDKIKKLSPQPVKLSTRTATHSKDAYQAKKQQLNDGEFTDGLLFSDVLLLDDLGAGNVIHTTLELKKNKGTCGVVVQVPTPLGSSETEERVFHSAILWARLNQLPVIGYELLPLDTRWTLAASLPDGVISKTIDTYSLLKKELAHSNIWLLPRHESTIFSPVSDTFDINGAKANYHYKNEYKIPRDRSVLFIPHNVAMVYEYQEMLRLIQPLGDRLHLMLCTGKDQVRGQYSQKQVIEIVYQKELASFASYSFHDMNSHWEIGVSDCVIACSACFHTLLAQEKNTPVIVFDPKLDSTSSGLKKRVGTEKELLNALSNVMEHQSKTTEFSDIFMQLVKAKETNG